MAKKKTEQYRQETGLTTAGKSKLLPEHQDRTGTRLARPAWKRARNTLRDQYRRKMNLSKIYRRKHEIYRSGRRSLGHRIYRKSIDCFAKSIDGKIRDIGQKLTGCCPNINYLKCCRAALWSGSGLSLNVAGIRGPSCTPCALLPMTSTTWAGAL